MRNDTHAGITENLHEFHGHMNLWFLKKALGNRRWISRGMDLCFMGKFDLLASAQNLRKAIIWECEGRAAWTFSLWNECCSHEMIHHQLLKLAQTHVHRVGDAIQLSCPLSSPSHASYLSQRQGLFQWITSSHQVAKILNYTKKRSSWPR